MAYDLKSSADAILHKAVSGSPSVPGVVAVATDRHGNTYEGAAGERMLGGAAMTTDSVFAIFSTTKAITGTTALQLMEEGKLDLDAPAKHYAPALGDIKVLDGFDAHGAPQTRAPKRDITTRMLLLHTAGFAYDFFNEHYAKLSAGGQPSVIGATKAAIQAPLLFDPGERWEYGCNIDWAGQVVEAITGKRLGEVMRERVFEPLGMHDTAFTMTPSMKERRVALHQRAPDGSLTAVPEFELPQDPEVHMGGHGLYGTAGDYCKFIRMWLNDGAGPHGRVLKAETVHHAAQNGLGDMKIKALPTAAPTVTNEAEFFPGMPKSWALTFMINEQAAPTGRPAGALAWAGLANLYYWIDRQHGVGGFWATQLFPFADPTSVGAYMDFETAVYQSIAQAKAA